MSATAVIELKTWPQFYSEVEANRKRYEIRKDDRPFAVGSVLHLREWDPATGAYTGRECRRVVAYLMRDYPGLAPGYCLMSIAYVPVQQQEQDAAAVEAMEQAVMAEETATITGMCKSILAAIRGGNVPTVYCYKTDFHDLWQAAEKDLAALRAQVEAAKSAMESAHKHERTAWAETEAIRARLETAQRAADANMRNWRETAAKLVDAKKERDAAIAAKEKAESIVANRCAACGGTTVAGKCGWCERFDAAIAAKEKAEAERDAAKFEVNVAIAAQDVARGCRDALQARVAELELDLAHERKVATERANIATARDESYADVRSQRDALKARVGELEKERAKYDGTACGLAADGSGCNTMSERDAARAEVARLRKSFAYAINHAGGSVTEDCDLDFLCLGADQVRIHVEKKDVTIARLVGLLWEARGVFKVQEREDARRYVDPVTELSRRIDAALAEVGK